MHDGLPMTPTLKERLNQILPKLISDAFLSGRGLGNEIAFHIFDYAAEEELEVRDFLRTLLDHLPKQRPGLRVKHINLFDFVLDHLTSRNLLDKSIQMQREKGDAALKKALAGVLHESEVRNPVRRRSKASGTRPRHRLRRRNRLAAPQGPFPVEQPAFDHGADPGGRVLPRKIRRSVLAPVRKDQGLQLLSGLQARSVIRG